MALLRSNSDKQHVWPWSRNIRQAKWQQTTWRWVESVTTTRKTTNTKVKLLLLLLKFRLGAYTPPLPPPAPRRSLYYYYYTVLTCFRSSCCLLFIGGPLGTRTGETFDVFENVVFPLWNIVGLALGSVGAYNKNICGRSASNITTRCLSLKKTQHTKCQLLKSRYSDHISLSTYLIQMIFMPQLPTPNHTIKPPIQWPPSVERTVIKVRK